MTRSQIERDGILEHGAELGQSELGGVDVDVTSCPSGRSWLIVLKRGVRSVSRRLEHCGVL